MQKTKQVVEGHVTVHDKSGAVMKEVKVPVGEVASIGPTANVGFSATFTKNLGNYESVKMTVSLYYPVALADAVMFNDAAVSARMQEVQGWVDRVMGETIESADL